MHDCSSPARSSLLAFLLAASTAACSADQLGPIPEVAGSTSGDPKCVASAGECPVVFQLRLDNQKSVELRGDFAPGAWEQGVPMQLDGVAWKTTLYLKNGQRVRYKFFVDGTTWVVDPKNPDKEPDGFGSENSVVVAHCDTSQCQAPPDTGTPDGGGPLPGKYDWRSAVLYFVFVDRFFNGDPSNDAPLAGVETPANYQGGDYAGVIQKIEEGYFDDLGVTALWLTVPFQNPEVPGPGADGHQYSGYHGYWPSDLEKIEEHFGDEALLQQLVDTAHAHGIKVLLDYAMNHVHAAASIYAEHPDWFWTLDYDGKHCVCGEGCDWNDEYEQKRCWFRDYLPDWNFQNPEARAYSVDNAVKWIAKLGIDGYRLDAVKHIETIWIEDFRKRVDAEIDAKTGERFYMVGETFESGNKDVIAKYVAPHLLDGQFDFPLRGVLVEKILRRSGSMYELDDFVKGNENYYAGVMSTFIGNHDIARVIQTALDQPWGAWDNGGDANWTNPPQLPNYRAPFERLAVAFTFLFTTRGIPLIYYGDEIGMPGAGDPDNRRFMQWSGYSADQEFLLEHVKKLGKIRKEHPALWRGVRETVSVTHDTYGYVMKDGDDQVFVALNRGDSPGAVDGMPASGQDLVSGEPVTGPTITLPPRSVAVVIPK